MHEPELSSVTEAGEYFPFESDHSKAVVRNETGLPDTFIRLNPSQERFLSILKNPHNIAA
jgi:hypothetical protein